MQTNSTPFTTYAPQQQQAYYQPQVWQTPTKQF